MLRIFIFLFSFLFFPTFSLAKSGSEHVADMLSMVFNSSNIRAPEVRSSLYEFTKLIDNFEIVRALPLGPDGHRLYGHWGYSDSIPFNREPLKGMLDKIALTKGKEAAEAAKEKIIHAWRKDVAKMEELSARLLGVRGRAAKGFAGLLYDVHLLGDYSGAKLGALQNCEALMNDLIKNINRIFGNHSSQSRQIIKALEAAYASGEAPAERAARMLEYLSGSQEFRTAFQYLLGQERFLASILKAPQLSEVKGIKSIKDLKRLVRSQVKSAVRMSPALIHNGKILVPMEAGVGAGFLVFTVDSAVPTWQFMKGNILKPEFMERITQAVINGTGVGAATAVMVILGANPAGLVVAGIATGTYIAIDKMQQVYRENKNSKYLTKDDLMIFGIQPDSILDIPVDESIPLNFDKWYN